MESELLRKLFQQEFSKMVAVISRKYGLQHIETAEDIVSETFLLATETWDVKGTPENPAAWLYTVAKQKTLSFYRRNKIYEEKVIPALISKNQDTQNDELDFSLQNINDSRLRMIFAVCNPAIASEAQIGLALRILCGFGIEEIAEAFLSNKETITKRLYRAKEKFRSGEISIEFPTPDELPDRLNNVLHVIYLLFNEGYYSKTKEKILSKDLCLEALRLALLLTECEATNKPKTKALIALFCFHSSRFDARLNNSETESVLYEEQNDKLWDKNLINQGIHYLKLSAEGDEISSYHLEAKIAYRYSIKENSPEKWEEILQLYNQLLMINYSPVAALNRTYALSKVKGKEAAIIEAEKLKLEKSHYYFLLLGELYTCINNEKAFYNFQKAYTLARTSYEKDVIKKKISKLKV